MQLPARPFVSFVLATYNRGPILLDCLHKTLANATASLGEAHFDIQIVDNASSDGTAERIAEFAAKNRHIKLNRLKKNCGPVAKNIALKDNPADILVLLDDDAYPLPGAIAQMVRHFQDDPRLGAAVFDVTLPDGRKEASAYPDVFIGAGTALRGTALQALTAANNRRPGKGLLPADFFMQAEEYDLSFRLLEANWSIQRFWDMPLMHLKTPGARIGQRTTRLDVRNNLWLLARYLPDPLATDFAADWLARYWRMALTRDAATGTSHKAAFLRGMAEGLLHWPKQRGPNPLSPATLEIIFKFQFLHTRLARAKERYGLTRIAFADWGKNLLAFHRAAIATELEIVAIMDDHGPGEYRHIPIISEATFKQDYQSRTDAIILTPMSRVHSDRRAAALRRCLKLPVLDLLYPASNPAPNVRNAALARLRALGFIIGMCCKSSLS